MFDFNALLEFSRTYCIAICAFLVPTNLLLTLQTILLTGLRRPQNQVLFAAILACIPALVIVFHVFTWFIVGVVMAPTFILLWLASTCLGINFWAIAHPQSMSGLLRKMWSLVTSNRQPIAQDLRIRPPSPPNLGGTGFTPPKVGG